jgi:hypothetical protein
MNKTKTWLLALLLAGTFSSIASAQIVDAWHFDGVPDNTSVDDPACASTGIVGGVTWKDKSIVVISVFTDQINSAGRSEHLGFTSVECCKFLLYKI